MGWPWGPGRWTGRASLASNVASRGRGWAGNGQAFSTSWRCGSPDSMAPSRPSGPAGDFRFRHQHDLQNEGIPRILEQRSLNCLGESHDLWLWARLELLIPQPRNVMEMAQHPREESQCSTPELPLIRSKWVVCPAFVGCTYLSQLW